MYMYIGIDIYKCKKHIKKVNYKCIYIYSFFKRKKKVRGKGKIKYIN